MIDRASELPVARQAELLGISRGSVYYLPQPVSPSDLALMRRIDEMHLDQPWAGARSLRDWLVCEGYRIGRKHVTTLMRHMGIALERLLGCRRYDPCMEEVERRREQSSRGHSSTSCARDIRTSLCSTSLQRILRPRHSHILVQHNAEAVAETTSPFSPASGDLNAERYRDDCAT